MVSIPVAKVVTLVVVLQQIEVDGHDAVLIFGASETFLDLLQYLAEESFSEGRCAFAELVEVGLLPDAVDGLGEDGRGEFYGGEQLGELFSGSLQMGFLVYVRCERDNDGMFLLFHNECKGNIKNGLNEENTEIIHYLCTASVEMARMPTIKREGKVLC